VTEAEWNACTDPQPMLEFLQGKASDRKLWLIAVGYCRSIWRLMNDPRSRRGVEVAEQVADGYVTRTELEQVSQEATTAWREHRDVASAAACQASFIKGVDDRSWLEWIASSASDTVAPEIGRNRHARVHVLHEVFGNPFRPTTLDQAWLTGSVVSLAQAIYTDRAFDRLPVLADALEDAGCTNQDILDHCRQPGEHCRGCWVVDLLLGKE
jgi:hypothetical protein